MKEYLALADTAERQFGLPPGLVRAVMKVESGGNPRAVSPAGAQGLMQFMPATARQYGIDPMDPAQAVPAGARMLSELHRKYGGDLDKTLAAYNFGQGNVDRGRPWPKETQDYIPKVKANMGATSAAPTLVPVQGDPFADATPAAGPKLLAVQGDPFAGEASAAPAPPGASAAKGGKLAGAAMGARDAVDAGAQLLRRAVPESVGRAVDAAGNWLAEKLPGIVAPSTGVAGVDAIVKDANAEYEASRKLAGREGFDAMRMAGTIANPVNRVLPGLGKATTAGRVAVAGAAQGAISGALQPVLGEDFAGEKAGQVAGGAAGGAIAGPVAAKVADGLTRIGQRFAPQATGASAAASAAMGGSSEEVLQVAANKAGIDLGKVSDTVRQQMREEITRAMRMGRTIDAAAVLRRADFEALGMKPTQGQITLDPKQITREMNLRGVNGAGEPLMNLYQQQNRDLIGALNARGAAAEFDPLAAGRAAIAGIQGRDDFRRSVVDNLYDAARASSGRGASLDHVGFVGAANDALDSKMLGTLLPGEIRELLNRVAKGELPLTVNTAVQLDRVMSTAQRSATRAGAEAIGAVRSALHAASIDSAEGATTKGIFDLGRKAAAARFATHEIPAVKAAVDGVEPDRFFSQFIVGNSDKASIGAVKAAAGQMGDEARHAVRQQILSYLKAKALNGARDEVGNFSQSGYNAALRGIGRERLEAFFGPDQIEDLYRIGRVAAYSQVQPRGAAVNNSNTGAAVANVALDALRTMGQLPGLNLAVGLAKKSSQMAQAHAAMKAQAPTETVDFLNPGLRRLLVPAAVAAGAVSGAQ